MLLEVYFLSLIATGFDFSFLAETASSLHDTMGEEAGHGNRLIRAVAIIGVLGIGAQWLAWRFQVPAIVMMSLAGLMVGPFAQYIFGQPVLSPQTEFGDLQGPIISLAVAIILFEGGLNLNFKDLRQAGPAVSRLFFFGGPVAWVLCTGACYFGAGLPLTESLLFGGILVVTGPTVIMPLLKQSKLGGRPSAVLKWEGILNDPVGALFAVIVFEVAYVLSKGGELGGTAIFIIFAAIIAAFIGIAAGMGLARVFRNGWTSEELKAPIIFCAVLFVFAIAERIEGETGLVAVTAFGMTVANSKLASLHDMRRFKETITTMLVSGVFVILTASLTPEVIASALNWQTLFFLILMLFVARPLTVFLTTGGTLEFREQLLVGWIAPRGIVAVAITGFFAEKLVGLGYEEAARLVPLAFAMSFATVVLHGFTLGPLARRLGLARKERPGLLIAGSNLWSLEFAKTLRELNIPIIIADNSWAKLRPAREAGLQFFYGEILSEAAEHRLDHSAFDQALALSSSEHTNSLICQHFAPELGRHRVFQFSNYTAEEAEHHPLALHIGARGRTLIKRGVNQQSLIRDWYKGHRFSKTTLTDEYNFEALKTDRPQTKWVAELKEDGALVILGPHREAKGEKGSTMIGFGPEF